MKKLVWIGALIAAAVIVMLVLRNPSQESEAQTQPEAEIEVANSEEAAETKEKEETIHGVALVKAERREVHTYVSGTGTLQALRQVEIFSKTAGQIEALAWEEGDQVRAGEVLLTLDAGAAQLKLDQAKVKLAEATADFDRTSRSYAKALVSTQDYETKKFQLEKIQAEVDLAAYDVETSQVRAPFDGTLITRDVELGQTIQTSQKLFTLATLQPLKTEVFLPERKVAGLSTGLPVEVSTNGSFENVFPGRLDLIAPVVDKETGTVKVTIAVDDVPGDLRPGAYVHLRIVTHREVADAVIPKKALVFDSRQNTFAFLAKPGENEEDVYTVEKVPVELGIQEDQDVSVLTGVRHGDWVVLTGKESLREGSKVKDVTSEVRTLAQN